MTPQIDISPAIRVRDLVKRYPGRPPVEAVRGLSLEVMRGECFGLLGPNGAGKTTTVEILEGLLAPSSGDVEVLGLTWENNKQQLRQQIGASLQETRLSDKLTVGETIRLFRSFYAAGLDPEAALEMVGLSAKAKVRVGNVSGGERQRLAVATAIVGWPQLVFLDEPTAGLDPQSRRQIWDLVEACRACGHTVLLTTHSMDEAERLCDRLAIVDQGRIIAAGTPGELVAGFGGADLDDVFVRLAGRRLTESGWLESVEKTTHSLATSPAADTAQEGMHSTGDKSQAQQTPPLAVPSRAALNRPRSTRPTVRPAVSPTTRPTVLKPALKTGGFSPFYELVRSRFLEFWREPEAIFWVYGFPVLMVLALGLAYREKPIQQLRVDVVAGPQAAADAAALNATLPETSGGLRAAILQRSVALERLRTGRSDLVIQRDDNRDDKPEQTLASAGDVVPEVTKTSAGLVRYHFDPSRPESALARDRAHDRLERAAGRSDLLASRDEPLLALGGRYIDFLIPGLMGLSLMGGGLWGVGFIAVEMRIRKLLKRFLATPMQRWQFLLSVMVSRMLFMIPEMLLLVLCARFVFDVHIFGSGWAVAFLIFIGAVCFSGLGLLVASRAQTLEAVSGVLNFVMLPMWLGSGVFFPRERYPDALQPILRALPLTPLVDALRGVMLEGRSLGGCWEDVALVSGWGLVSFAVALRFFRWH